MPTPSTPASPDRPESGPASSAESPLRRMQPPSRPPTAEGEDDWTEHLSHQFEESIGKPSREAIHTFFYPSTRRDEELEGGNSRSDVRSSRSQQPSPPQERRRSSNSQAPTQHSATRQVFDAHFDAQAAKDRQFVEHFWTAYDDILILSIFTQLGIIFRLGASTWFAVFDSVFSAGSPLFVNLPLNCMSLFIMGLLCSGESLMEIIATRFSPPRLQQRILHSPLARRKKKRGGVFHRDSDDDDDDDDMIEDDDDESMHPAPSGLLPSAISNHSSPRTLDDQNSDENDHLHSDDDGSMIGGDSYRRPHNELPPNLRRRGQRRRRKKEKKREFFHFWEPPVRLNEDLRDVQLLALERRIRASKCLLLFPVRKEDVDVMEHYFHEGYKGKRRGRWDHDDGDHSSSNGEREDDFGYDLELQTVESPRETNPSANHSPQVDPLTGALPAADEDTEDANQQQMTTVDLGANVTESTPRQRHASRREDPLRTPTERRRGEEAGETERSDDQAIPDVTANVMENVSRLSRVNIVDGWDSGTTPEAMSDDIMLGLRSGFCGALSSFSSWNSSMVHLMRNGKVGEAFVGYMLGIQLPIIAYRFGQHIAVYMFVWRCRYESKRDERRGYGIRVSMNDQSDRDGMGNPLSRRSREEIPSVRAIVTAVFIMALVTQCTSLSFYSDPQHQQIALSLLFSPLGVLARWRLTQFNAWRPTFPLGTFTANILACALSGGLGSLLAGNPGPRERIALVSFVAGFGGTLSSLAAFIVEILAGIDPVLFRFDGMIYAILSVFWALVTGFVFSASVDWADATE